MLSPGDKAPSFSLVDQDGTKRTLDSFKGRSVLVYFYPKADTPGCTQQACGLRDVLGDIGDYSGINEWWRRQFPDPAAAPARLTFQAGALPFRAKVEFQAVAARRR